VPNIIKTTHCLEAMSTKDKINNVVTGAQKLRNDRPEGAAVPPAPPSVSPLDTAKAWRTNHSPSAQSGTPTYPARNFRDYPFQTRSHGGHWATVPLQFLCLPNFVVSRKICFKHI